MGSNLPMYGVFISQMTPWTTVESAYYSVGRHNSTRVDEETQRWIIYAIKMQGTYRTAEGEEETITYVEYVTPDLNFDHNRREQGKKRRGKIIR